MIETDALIEKLNRHAQIELLHHLLNQLLSTNEANLIPSMLAPRSAVIAETPATYGAERPRTFQDYFKLNLPSEEIAGLLGYNYQRQKLDFTTLNLPAIVLDPGRLANLLERLQIGLQQVGMYSEMARREFLIAPVLLEVLYYSQARAYIEYSLKASEMLQGSLDYLLKTDRQLLVVEAKQGDLQRGFHQLMAELAALDLAQVTNTAQLYGVVSMGDGWQFGCLDRNHKVIVQDTEHYGVPLNTATLVQIMVGILQRN